MASARGAVGVAVCLAAVVGIAGVAQAQDFRLGGALSASGAVSPVAAADVALEVVAGLDCVDFASWTEFSLAPYTIGSQTLAVSCTRDWLGLRAEYQFSLIPIGITRAAFVARARPAPWESVTGDLLWSVEAAAEARLAGDSFAAPLRAEVWGEVVVGASRALGFLDLVFVGAALEATVSAPGGGQVWPTPTWRVAATLGRFALRSETVLHVVGGLRVASETLTLDAAWSELGLSGSLWCTFAESDRGPSLGMRFAAEFGDRPLEEFRSGGTCSGGVCR